MVNVDKVLAKIKTVLAGMFWKWNYVVTYVRGYTSAE